MKNRCLIFLFSFLSLNISSLSGLPQIKERFKKHINYLASDALRGREAGTESEKQAAAYIRNEFIQAGLTPAGNGDTYYQDFEFLDSKTLGNNNFLSVDGETLKIDEDYIPLVFSANGSIQGKTFSRLVDSENTCRNGNSQRIFLIDVNESEKIAPGRFEDFYELRNRAQEASGKGAEAVIFYNFNPFFLDCKLNLLKKMAPLGIPGILILKKNLIQPEFIHSVSMKIELINHYRIARNVVGWINNGVENTVVIGAHFDHLGVSHKDIHTIYNGADDNASGIAILIELARWMSIKGFHNKNYLFIAFSGEEKGLLGSIYFTNNMTIPLKNIACMICLDQVGRMDEMEKIITLFGKGTSPLWDNLIGNISSNDYSIESYLTGVGPTDFTSFYLKNIPVLGFSTGFNIDFHEPTDDINKINYDGMLLVFAYATTLLSAIDTVDNIEFTKTIESEGLLTYLFRFIDFSFDGKYNWKASSND